MMAGPPGEPTESAKRLFLSKTMVGDIELSGSLPGAGALATGKPFKTGWKEKKVKVLLSKKPLAMISAPKVVSTEVVIAATSPASSTMVMCEVPCSTGEICGEYCACFSGGDPGRAVPISLVGSISL